MSSSFPDQVHVDRIREALWSRLPYGNAAILVGAGMSRNAKPAVLGQGTFPDWTELAHKIVNSLYPEHEAGYNEQREAAFQQIKATSGILRFSQEFDAAFGRTALDRLIIDSIPEERFEPGELHEILLDLPWSDVFTTNWDTLLERGSRRLLERRYDVVRTIPEIPRSMKPRIVKLHGSLPANAPFILTEEDFRTYPVNFAPFVNMVQQSMMENVFCLVGFSGDDPNFLYWSGWVRDHLGPSAPKIYLVGWLGLSSPRRRMLEDRGVVPVDLSALPHAADWPSNSRHRWALDWFLWSLRLGEPYQEANWPHVRRPPRKPNGQLHLQGIATSSRPEPKQEHLSPLTEPKPDEKPLEQLRSEIQIWKHNRSLYPGWVIAPPEARLQIWLHTQRCLEEDSLEEILHAAQDGLLLSHEEIDSVFAELFAWQKRGGPAATEKPRDPWSRSNPRDLQWPVVGLLARVLLPLLSVNDGRIGPIVDLVEDLRSSGFPVEPIYPVLLRLRPELRSDLSLRLRRSLSSLENQPAQAAIEAVWNWLRYGESWGIGPPADDLSREIAIAISVRRPSNLQRALQAAEWMLVTKNPAATAEFARFVSEGLGYLLEEAQYERAPEAEKIPGFPEIPELRAQCVRTAQALEHAGYESEPPVTEWLAVKASDPLPEVRLARSQWIENRAPLSHQPTAEKPGREAIPGPVPPST